MFDKYYQFNYCNYIKHTKGDLVYKEHKLTFTCRFNQRYIVNVEEYQNWIFVVKFHLKSHSNSENKYSLRTKFGDANRVIMTCIHISAYVLLNRDNSNPNLK